MKILNESLIKTLLNINQKAFVEINTNSFLQGSQYNNNKNKIEYFNYSLNKLLNSVKYSINSKKDLNSEKKNFEKEILKKEESYSLLHILINHIIPIHYISTKNEFIKEFKEKLDKYRHLLKTITIYNKKLRKDLEFFLEKEVNEDIFYENKNIIIFWCNILDLNITIIEKNKIYTTYLPTYKSNNNILLNKIEKNKYTFKNLKNENIEEYLINKNYIKFFSDKELNKMKLSEIQELCVNHYKIEIKESGKNLKKQLLIDYILEKLK